MMLTTLTGLSLVACATTSPTRSNVGLVDGRLRACPSSPNCVCSQGKEDEQHAIEPIAFRGDLAETKKRLREAIQSLPRTRFVEEQDGYWRVEFTTFLMRFVDDVEFLFDAKAKVVHVRSASRVGYSDLGANRKRVETIREKFKS